jgi:Flp pilus assembly protein TadD
MTSELEQAVAHQKAGRLSEAEEIYRRLLAAEPEHPEALHWLGVLFLQRDVAGSRPSVRARPGVVAG